MFLPQAVKDKLPDDIVNLILSYLPKKKKKGHISPSLQRELEKLQKLTLKGKCGMYLREFDVFSLDSDMY
jgi:hypothetical protein